MNTVMVIAPHHDDEVIGCGGSICLHKQRGDQIAVVFFTAGWSGIPWITDRKEAALKNQAEAAAAAKILGIDQIIELNLEDRNLQASSSALPTLISTIRRFRPQVIYLPHSEDGDSEHRFVNSVATEAIWIAASNYLPELGEKSPSVRLILGYEVWQPLRGYSLSVDITACLETKLAAIEAYSSQLKQKNWRDGLLGLASFRGAVSGKGKYAEVFQVVKVSDKFLKL